MPQIKHIASGNIIEVSDFPVLSGSIWECGDRRFLDESGTQYEALPWTPPPILPLVPEAVTMRQARLALLGAGQLASVNNAIAGMTGSQGDAARIEWEFSSEVRRSQPLVLALGPTLGMSSAQLDALFVAAAKL